MTIITEKHFITANILLEDSFALADQIFQQGYHPDFIIGIWRGGTPIGIAIQEYMEYKGIHADHFPIRTRAYANIDTPLANIAVHGLDYVISHVHAKQKLLIVDDVFDSGRSIRAVIHAIREQAKQNTPQTIKIACPWLKPLRNTTDITPDFFIHTTDKWLVFPHELIGLSDQEIIDKKGKNIAEKVLAGSN